MKKFKLISNSKRPLYSWSKQSNWTTDDIPDNYGIVCGKPNNITVVDLDTYKWEDDHPFYGTFTKEYMKKFQTYTVKSPNGGIHLYFQYDQDLYTIAGKEEIDIRNDGGYIVGPGSSIDGKKYEIIMDKPFQPLPAKLKDFLLKYVYVTTKKTIKERKIKEQTRNDTIQASYIYDMSDSDIDFIMAKLDKNYLDNFSNWLKFTTFCKILKKPEVWDKYSMQAKNYDKNANLVHWNSINKGLDYLIVESFLKEAKIFQDLPYYRYKPVPTDKTKPTITFNSPKIGYDYIKPKINYILKADTGTGKTTTVKHYLKKQDDQFVSICSRVSLCQEQYKIFNEHGLDCALYQMEPFIDTKDSIVIQLDSINRISNFDFTKTIVFMDEFNSIIEYLITSPTLTSRRVPIFRLFMRIMKEAKQIICVDADISDMCFKILKSASTQYEYHQNEYQHARGVHASEMENRTALIEYLKKEEKYIVCCDSKTECKSLYTDMLKANPTKPIKLITSDLLTTEKIDLDAHDRVIFSPKVIYGLDSIMRRSIYCIYKSKTISPKHMVQQINRCRDIIDIKYLFLNKRTSNSNYSDLNDCMSILKAESLHNVSEFKEVANENENALYLELLTFCEYNSDCYSTNKFLHFKQILKARGVIDGTSKYREDKKQVKTHKQIVAEDLKNFNKDDPKIQEMNEYLHVPDEEMETYKEYLVDPIKLSYHWHISDYFLKDTKILKESVKTIEDFKVNYVTSNRSKMIYLKELIELAGVQEDADGILSITKKITAQENEKLKRDYKIIFRLGTELDFTDESKLLKQLSVIYKQLFGAKIITSTQVGKGKLRKRIYKINKSYLKEEEKLFRFRHPIIDIILPNELDEPNLLNKNLFKK